MRHAFPAEFSDILNGAGRRRLLERRAPNPRFAPQTGQVVAPVAHYEHVVQRRFADRLVGLLDECVFPYFDSPSNAELPSTWCLPHGYARYARTRTAPFSQRLRTGHLCRQREPELHRIARRVGLLKFLASQSLRRFVRAVSGETLRFGTGRPYGQVSCYQNGDYVGQHTDWFGEAGRTERFLLFQLTLPNRAVAHHSLIYQNGAFLNGMLTHTGPGVSLLRLPFWHMTTPLQALPGREDIARRWLITAAFQICDPV